jgi:hypothetical protein
MSSLAGLRKELGRRPLSSSGVVPSRVAEPPIDRLTADRLAGVLSLLYSASPGTSTMRLPTGVSHRTLVDSPSFDVHVPGSAFGLPTPEVFAPENLTPEFFTTEVPVPEIPVPAVRGAGRHRRSTARKRGILRVAMRNVGVTARRFAMGPLIALVAIAAGVWILTVWH